SDRAGTRAGARPGTGRARRSGSRAPAAVRRALEAVEAEIEALEARRSDLEERLADPATYADAEQARRVTGDHRRVVADLEELYERWARLAEEAEPEA